MEKYEMIQEGSMYRIVALRDFGNVEQGDKGGIIAKEANLSHDGDAWVYGNAKVYGDAEVSGNAWVYGDAKVYGNAKIYENYNVQFGRIDVTNLKQIIACSLNVYPIRGKYYLYKRVNKISDGEYQSCYDESFLYKDGKIAKAENINEDTTQSCASGLHVSTPFYWNDGDTLIAVEVDEKDIICCQEGKLRVRQLKVIGEVK